MAGDYDHPPGLNKSPEQLFSPCLSTVWPFILLCLFCSVLFAPAVTMGGAYTTSAHGDSAVGVNRTGIDSQGYARGNCTHCHEQHASIGGSEPAPIGGAPSGSALFADKFSDVGSNPYSESDNYCFSCHINLGSVQSEGGISNLQYSDTFGCAGSSDANDILGAFNLLSYHNLEDVQTFAGNKFSFFQSVSNPCVACHNPHRAKRNRADPDNPAASVLSRPTDHENLWGQSMADTYNEFEQEFEPPYCASSANREPDASLSAAAGAQNTPDYVTFCTDCHNSTNEIPSATLGRNVRKINWSASGDKHGLRDRDVASGVLYKPLFIKHPERPPYVVNFLNDGAGYMTVNTHNVLSCMDCHEPHGSANVTLLRSRVNSEALTANITSSEVYNPSYDVSAHDKTMGYLCQKCHKDDYQMAGGGVNAWRWVHHKTEEAPYRSPGACGTCAVCHGPGSGNAISCSYCHFHGSDDIWMDTTCASFTTGRKTF